MASPDDAAKPRAAPRLPTPERARPRPATPRAARDSAWGRTPLAWIASAVAETPDAALALAVAALATAVFYYSAPPEPTPFDYFVRLADAFLHGRFYLLEGPSWLNELVPTAGGFYVVYPPMPAVVLMPFVAVFGTQIAQQGPNALFGGAAIGLLWLALGRFDLTLRRRALLTAVFAFGSVFWYTTEAGSAWYMGHTVAVLFAVAALLPALDRRHAWLVGLLLGCAAVSRLPVALTAPFYLAMLLGLGWPPRIPAERMAALRTTVGFGVGVAIPVGLYAIYNLARWGTVVDQGFVLIPGVLNDPIYSHGIFSIDYIPRELYAMFLRSWNFEETPPFLKPSWAGLAVPLTTPLVVWVLKARPRDPRVFYAAIGVGLALIPIVTHGNVGLSQFGYRFSLDVQPLLWVILATVFERGGSRLAVAAGVASIAINLYAVWAIGIGFVSY